MLYDVDFQGLLFYVPHWVWKNWEEGKVRMISDGMRGTAATIADDKNNRLVRIFITTINRSLSMWYYNEGNIGISFLNKVVQLR